MPDSTKAISYTDLIAVIIEAIKEQQAQIEALQTSAYLRENEIARLHEAIRHLSSSNNGIESKSETIFEERSSTNESSANSGKLLDNIPNPFSSTTEIKFEISKMANYASLIINDLQGTEIKSYKISQKGFGSIILSSSELKTGIYFYTLIIDNKIIDTKKMILTKY